MHFRIADSFTKALGRLTGQEQSAAKVSVFDLQQDPTAPGLNLHRIEGSKDPHFRSVRVNRDIRIILHKTDQSVLLCYVGHHDDAYHWAERRRIETHPKTGAAQIVEIREKVVEIPLPVPTEQYAQEEVGQATGLSTETPPDRFLPPLFIKLTRDELLSVGVPEEWCQDIRMCSEDSFFDIADHIPEEAGEALLNYVITGILQKPEEADEYLNPFDHPDAQRRFRVMEDMETLSRALEYPWEKWTIFLHPSQQSIVEKDFSAPARVSGSAGTGKTVVALHRTARILKSDPGAKVLLTTFSSPLSNMLEHKLKLLSEVESGLAARVTVLPFQGVARELFTLAYGYDPRPAKAKHIEEAIQAASVEINLSGFSTRFLLSEWNNVVDAWQIGSLNAYRDVPRLGRKNRLGARQRETIWPVFERVREVLGAQNILTWPTIFRLVTEYYKDRDHKPFSHIVVDEAQDLGVPELRMLAAVSGTGKNALFFAGDLGQRIFQEPFSWLALGVDIRGRSSTLKVNYRTSHQIREAADHLLPATIRDVDGNEDERLGTVSVFNGPAPEILLLPTEEKEIEAVGLWVHEMIDEGIEPDEIGIFVRSDAELRRARAAVREANQTAMELSDKVEARNGRISIGRMHLAKGLEFKAVVVMACDDDLLPLQSRVETVADEAELEEVHNTERHLFYVACTRSRDRLLVTGVDPGSEFLEDLEVTFGSHA